MSHHRRPAPRRVWDLQPSGVDEYAFHPDRPLVKTYKPVLDIPISELISSPATHLPDAANDKPIFVVCRLGNDSQLAADALRTATAEAKISGRQIMDVIGGLRSWSRIVDSDFPLY